MMVYRVDKRKFEVDEVISPETSFETTMQNESKEMENLLNELRPTNIPERKNCLFLFQDLICALRFYSKYGGTIYGVEIPQCYFRGDMNKLDNILDMFRYTEDNNLRKAAVNEYWKAGTHTFNPCYEILASKARVKRIICNNDLLQNVREEIRNCGNSIEHTSIYKTLLRENH